MKNRDLYLNQLIDFKDKDLIKVITGVRRCGKSTLLLLYKEYLLKEGIKESNIIEMNFESLTFDDINDYKDLYNYVKSKIKNKSKHYILLDEIQEVDNWEKALRSFRVDFNVDIYITGSNAHLLSGELATLLSGRCIQIKMFPLSFSEYIYFIETTTGKKEMFNDYLKYGGLPSLTNLKQTEAAKTTYLKDIFDMIVKRDVIARNKLVDVGLLEKILVFLSMNIGSTVSSKKISDYLTSNANPTTHNTVDNYIKYLENALILYKVKRHDIKGKKVLKTLGKYYFVDTGIKNAITGYRGDDRGHILENVVYYELLRRGYEVNIGKLDDKEIDFIATSQDEIKYIQVTETMLGEETRDRELFPLQNINDNFEKIILSLDETYIKTTDDGIKIINIIDFLLDT